MTKEDHNAWIANSNDDPVVPNLKVAQIWEVQSKGDDQGDDKNKYFVKPSINTKMRNALKILRRGYVSHIYIHFTYLSYILMYNL